MLANEGKTECLNYSINDKEFSQVYHMPFFQGAADVFMARRTRPSSKNSAAVKMLSSSMYPQQAFIITYNDRVSWGSELGTYFLCAQAYDSFSAYASVDDTETLGVVSPATKLTQYNFMLQRASGHKFVFP